jgi:hypothetical protein
VPRSGDRRYDGAAYSCSVVWRKSRRIGVSFR